MADSSTPNLEFTLPEVGASAESWGGKLNTNWETVDAALFGGSPLRPNLAQGNWTISAGVVTSSASELNNLHGVTWNLINYNGLHVNVTELNYTDGARSNIQDQIDTKQADDATLTALAGTGTAANKVPYFTDVDEAAELTFRDQDNMSSDDPLAVASQQSIKAYVDALAATVFAVGQSWGNYTLGRESGVIYQNTTARPIMIAVSVIGSSNRVQIDISEDGSTWSPVSYAESEEAQWAQTAQLVVPAGQYYRATYFGTGSIERWMELR